MRKALDPVGLDQIFRDARSYNGWKEAAIDDAALEAIYTLAAFGPTSANCSPARFVFLRSDAARERLKPHLIPGNVDKVMTASVVALIAWDLEFYEKIP